MSNFATLTAQLNLNMQNFTTNINRASAMANKFAKNMQGKINAGMVEPAKQAKFEFKDVSRIVQGIVISKTFYSSLNAIRQAKDAVWEFSKELEYAQMVYSNLFGSTALASEFINVLKDFAAVTPFTFKQSEQAAKRLLAYGIEYQNIMYVMQGVLAAATVQGNDAIIEPISRAFGQIYTKGRLMNEEMRQLAEAGIPVYEILQEKLGLSAEQLRNLGREAIPAKTAINALVQGINERFGTVLQDASLTTTGIISNIKDNAVMLFSGIFEPLTAKAAKSFQKLGYVINDLRQAFELQGIGGVFEKLVPKDMQGPIRSFVSSFKLLFAMLKSDFASLIKIAAAFGKAFMQIFNAVAPPILLVLGVLSSLLYSLANNEKAMDTLTTVILMAAAAWSLYRVKVILAAATTAFIEVMSKAIIGLTTAMTFLSKHPVWSLLMLGAAIFVALVGSSEKFRTSVNNLYKDLFKFGGIKTDDIMLKESKERANDLSKFNEALGSTSSNMEDLADSTGKATQAAKNLLGFDEVFSLNGFDEGGAAQDLEDIIAGFNGLDFSNIEIPMPDVSGIASEFISDLTDAMGGKKSVLSAGIGSIIAAALGAIVGGPAGAKIGMALGAIAGWFWPEFAKKLELSDISVISMPILSGIGAALGFIAGGPLGSLAGFGIGQLVSWLIEGISDGIASGDWTGLSLPILGGIGAAIGFALGGPAGGVLGMAIGSAAGYVVDKYWNDIKANFNLEKTMSFGIGGLIGGLIGMIFGPAGAAVGAAVGGAAGSVVSEYWGDIKKEMTMKKVAPFGIGALIGGLIGMIFGPAGAAVGAAVGGAAGSVVSKYWGDIKAGMNMKNIAPFGIGALIGGLIGMIFGPLGAAVGAAVGGAAGSVVSKYWGDIKSEMTMENIAPFGIGAIIGGLIGMIFGPAGAAVGAAIGGAAGSVVSKYWDTIKSEFAKLDWDALTWTPGVPANLGSKAIQGLTEGKSGIWNSNIGHADGGVFNREHYAKFAEGNKKEAVIPLENRGAMQPFVDAVANGLTSALAPILVNITNSNQNQLQPLFVSTLIADDRGIKELERKMQLVRMSENQRRGLNG